MNRRGFLQGILAAGMMPAIVKADSLMKLSTPKIIMLDEMAWWKPAGVEKGVIRDHKWSFGDIYDFQSQNTVVGHRYSLMATPDHTYLDTDAVVKAETLARIRARPSSLAELRMLGIV